MFIYRLSLVALTCALVGGSCAMARGQSFDCPVPTRQVAQNIKGEVDGKAQTLLRVGELEFKGQAETTINNLWSAYPKADRIAIVQNFLSVHCNILKASNMSAEAKADRWEKVFELWLKYSPSGESKDASDSLVKSVSYAGQRARDAAQAGRQKAASYPGKDVAFTLQRVNEIEDRIVQAFNTEAAIVYQDSVLYYWGETRDNQPHGIGRTCCRGGGYTEYIGEWDRGQRTGYGKTKFKDGGEVISKYVRGNANGNGCIIYRSLSITCGFIDGLRTSGVVQRQFGGSLSPFSVERSVSEFDDKGSITGPGVIYFLADTGYNVAGSRYEGDTKNGMRNGYGVLYFPDGSRYEGQWMDRTMHGFGRRVASDGTVLSAGLWQNGTLEVSVISVSAGNN